MEFRFSERHIVALNFLMIAALAYFAALVVNDVVAHRLALAPTVPAAIRSSAPAAPAPQSRSDYQAIVDRDIFNLTPQESAPVSAPAVVEDLHLKLLGVSHLTLGKPFAIIEDRSGQQTLYRVGDGIPDAGPLVEVGRDHVIVEHSDHRVTLALPKSELPGPAPATFGPRIPVPHPPAAPQSPAKSSADDFQTNITDLGHNRYAIPRGTVDHSLNHLSELFTQARAVPNIQNGRTIGFALSEIESGSVFDEMGLEDGDVITSVNGQTINDPARAMQMLSLLHDRRVIQVEVLREGKPLRLTYEIR